MNKDNVLKWVEALESGKYQQGFGTLNSKNETFCCLGVACEVAILNGVELRKEKNVNGLFYYNGNPSTLPCAVQQWLDIDVGVGNPPVGGKSLASLNDKFEVSFEVIAKEIRKEWI